MKTRIYISILFFIAAIATFNACDKIEQPLLIVDQQDITNDLLDTLFFVDSVEVNTKHLLLEDFTGHTCINCPEWAFAAHDWAEENDHRLIIYAVHSGLYAEPDPGSLYEADLRSQVGIELNADFGVYLVGYPTGLINRVDYEGSKVIYPFFWYDVFEQELDKPNVIDLKVQNTFYPNLNTIQVDVLATFHQQLEGKYKIVVYVVEDNIISPQRNNNHTLPGAPDNDDWIDYKHRNVLRDAINGKYGTFISVDGSIVSGNSYSEKFIYELNGDWDASNCNIITYIYQEDSQEILQVAELGIKTAE
ncbi:MAG: Omp28-related outer membrane protein [Bacteroidales bacterium]|nr:Omp28-related outer membrane protein [Bacteroidales bacterium]MCF8403127.1 Omp28-related outer membrane protein [Bacteroidales bacterium]